MSKLAANQPAHPVTCFGSDNIDKDANFFSLHEKYIHNYENEKEREKWDVCNSVADTKAIPLFMRCVLWCVLPVL